MLLALLPIPLILAPVGEAHPQASTAVRQEFALREVVLFPERASWDLAPDWRERFAALEAIARRAPGAISESQRELAAVGLDDAHPNVRASALRVHARHALVLPPQRRDLVEDRHPRVRLALARALAQLPGRVGDELLLALGEDEDAGVAREARAQLLSRGEDSLEAQLALFELEPRRLDAAAFLDSLEVLERTARSARLAESVRLRYEEALAARPRTPGLAARLALWEALAIVQGETPWTLDFIDDFRGQVRSGADLDGLAEEKRARCRRLAENWLAALEGEDDTLAARRERRMQAAANAVDDPTLASDLLHAARALELRAERTPPTWKAAQQAAGRVEALRRAGIEALLACESFVAPGELPYPNAQWGEELVCHYFELAASRVDSWREEMGGFLSSQSRDVRESACDAFLQTWVRSGDARTARLLVDALHDPRLAARVYRGLVGSAREVPLAEEVWGYWRAQPEARQLELLGEHSRGLRFERWRELLIGFWASAGGRSVSVPELLAAFEGDEEVRELLRYWALAEIAELEAGEVPDVETTRGPWREAEARALWLVKAWARVARGEHVEQEIELLLRVGRLGKELGKFLVADLVKSAEGRLATRAILEREELSRRIRIEILLANRDLESPDELQELFVVYDTCDADLKLRILRRAAGLDDELVRARLLEVLLNPGASPAQRQRAVESLATAGPPAAVVPLLARVLDEVGDYDVKRVVIAALGQVAREGRELGLLELYRDATQRDLLGDELLPALVRIELRAKGELGEELAELWRARADEAAAPELERRFRAERLPARNFEYKGWLAAAEALAEADQLEAALGERWWTWDGRLLMQLAQDVRGSNARGAHALARRLDRGALVALLGEGEASDRPGLVVRCRARLLHEALRAHDWQEAHGWVRVLLDDWRSGRTTPNAIQSVFGSHDRDAERDPLQRLLTLEATTRGWQALRAGRVDEARGLAQEAQSRVRDSAAAREHLAELERAIDRAER